MLGLYGHSDELINYLPPFGKSIQCLSIWSLVSLEPVFVSIRRVKAPCDILPSGTEVDSFFNCLNESPIGISRPQSSFRMLLSLFGEKL